MKVLLDTNVVLDLLLVREPWRVTGGPERGFVAW